VLIHAHSGLSCSTGHATVSTPAVRSAAARGPSGLAYRPGPCRPGRRGSLGSRGTKPADVCAMHSCASQPSFLLQSSVRVHPTVVMSHCRPAAKRQSVHAAPHGKAPRPSSEGPRGPRSSGRSPETDSGQRRKDGLAALCGELQSRPAVAAAGVLSSTVLAPITARRFELVGGEVDGGGSSGRGTGLAAGVQPVWIPRGSGVGSRPAGGVGPERVQGTDSGRARFSVQGRGSTVSDPPASHPEHGRASNGLSRSKRGNPNGTGREEGRSPWGERVCDQRTGRVSQRPGPAGSGGVGAPETDLALGLPGRRGKGGTRVVRGSVRPAGFVRSTGIAPNRAHTLPGTGRLVLVGVGRVRDGRGRAPGPKRAHLVAESGPPNAGRGAIGDPAQAGKREPR